MSTNGIFIAGCIIIILPILGFIISIMEFRKMYEHPENYVEKKPEETSAKK